jgi:hypothetical protein
VFSGQEDNDKKLSRNFMTRLAIEDDKEHTNTFPGVINGRACGMMGMWDDVV